MPAIVTGLQNMPVSLKLMHCCNNRRTTILAMISLLSQKYERQRILPASLFQLRPSVKHIKNHDKALRAKVAKEYSQSRNSSECDIFGLEGFNKQAKPYKPKK